MISINWSVSCNSGTENVTFEDLGLESDEAFFALSEDEKQAVLQEYLDNLPERVFIMFDNYE